MKVACVAIAVLRKEERFRLSWNVKESVTRFNLPPQPAVVFCSCFEPCVSHGCAMRTGCTGIASPQRTLFLLAAICTAVPQITFLAGVVPYFCTVQAPRGWSVLPVGLVLMACSWTFFLLGAFRNPGTLVLDPSRSARFLLRDAWTGVPMPLRVAESRDGQVHSMKYCETCSIFRPPRARHCVTCGRCCSRMDHHCLWLGQCVGLLNYRYFLGFIFCITVTLTYGIVVCSLELIWEAQAIGFRAALVNRPHPTLVALLVAVYCVCVASMTGFLTLVHLWFMWTGRTTAEACGRGAIRRGHLTGWKGCWDALRPQTPETHLDDEKRGGVDSLWGYFIMDSTPASTAMMFIRDAEYDARWIHFERVREVVCLKKGEHEVEGSASSHSKLQHVLSVQDMIKLRRWIMCGLGKTNLPNEATPSSEIQAVEQHGRTILKQVLDRRDSTVLTSDEITAIINASSSWHQRIEQHRKEILCQQQSSSTAKGEPLDHETPTQPVSQSDRLIFSCLDGRFQITDSCV